MFGTASPTAAAQAMHLLLFPLPAAYPTLPLPLVKDNCLNFSSTFPGTRALSSGTHPTVAIALSRCAVCLYTRVTSFLSVAPPGSDAGSSGGIVGSPLIFAISADAVPTERESTWNRKIIN